MAAGLVALGACGESHDPITAASADTHMASGGNGAAQLDAGSNDRSTPVKTEPGAPARPDPDAGAGAGMAGSPSVPMSGASVDAGAATGPDPQADAVELRAVARNVLYSWTTQKQIAELRANPVLLTRSENSNGMRTNLSAVLASLGQTGDALAQVLASASFQKGRYAWSNAWATVRGWPDESYGDQLLRIVLKPEAWIAIVGSGLVRVVDMNNMDIVSDAALAHPERIAAVYFTNAGNADPNACGTFLSGCGTGAYREYFINNERMVLSWSLGTQAVLDEIERSIALIQPLRDELAATPIANLEACEFTRGSYCTWEGWGVGVVAEGQRAPSSPRLNAYRQALALTSDFYTPTLANMDALIAALKASVFTPDPFEHKP